MSRPCPPRPRRAFSLVEILVVVGIIAVLVGLVAGIGPRVFANQKKSQTAQLLNTLDRALEEYRSENNAIPKFDLALFEEGVPGIDARPEPYGSSGRRFPKRPDAAVFLHQIRGVGECDAIISGIPQRFLKLTPSVNPDNDVIPEPSILDAWSKDGWASPWPIADQQIVYYVHPDNQLAQDLYGRCINRRPYFVSAGSDLMYGLPETGTAIASALELSQESGESTSDFQNRVLRETRKNNVYSYPVNIDFKVNDILLGDWR